MTPFIADPDLTLWQGDVLDCLAEVPDASIHCVVTSPPYWSLRDYGTGEWDGGDPACAHERPTTSMNAGFNERWGQGAGQRKQEKKSAGQWAGSCPDCGAVRTDQQLGREEVHDCAGWATGDPCGGCFVCRLTEIFREVRRTLRPDGTLWLNLGDTYAAKARGTDKGWEKSRLRNPGRIQKAQSGSLRKHPQRHRGKAGGLKNKDLAGVPWRTALALQADGWWLRAENLWSKTNPMPSSVTDRPAVSHEQVFLLAGAERYFYDGEAVKEPLSEATLADPRFLRTQGGDTLYGQENGRASGLGRGSRVTGELRNRRTVWQIATEPSELAACEDCDAVFFKSADAARHEQLTGHKLAGHFAAFPSELARTALRAGASERGCCPECGVPWQRLVEKTGGTIGKGSWHPHERDEERGMHEVDRASSGGWELGYETRTVGWEPGCAHGHDPVPCRILDPFAGSGTTLVVARALGLASVGIELRPAYCRMVDARLSQQTLFATVP